MPSLMYFPQELLDTILELAIFSERPAPKTLAGIEAQKRTPGSTHTLWSTNPDDYAFSASPLLLVSKQMHKDTKALLKCTKIKYKLDVKFVHEQCLVPTWTNLPLFVYDVNNVCAVFQSVGEPLKKAVVGGHRWQDIWRGGDGGPPLFVWMFYDLLDNFLKSGPKGSPKPGKINVKGFTIATLEIDFVDPEDTSLLAPVPDDPKELERREALLPRRRWIGHEKGFLRPEWLAKCLIRQMRGLLNMGYHHARYGQILHKSIGSIVFKVNGTLLQELDLGQILADLRFNNSFGRFPWNERLDLWIKWKENAIQCRRRVGLKVVEPSANWKEEAKAEAARCYAGRTI